MVRGKLNLTFRTVVLPVARAGPIFHATIDYAKYISWGGRCINIEKEYTKG